MSALLSDMEKTWSPFTAFQKSQGQNKDEIHLYETSDTSETASEQSIQSSTSRYTIGYQPTSHYHMPVLSANGVAVPLQVEQLAVAQTMTAPGLVARIPDFAVPLQPKLLKHINTLSTKEELLNWVSQSHFLLDPINLVTCIYRLARMFSCIRSPDARALWRADLMANPTFLLLIRTVQSHLLHAQLMMMHNEDVKGLDARCVSNLIWAIVKLEVATDSNTLGSELVLTASPLVVRFLPNCSCQGLANLLWSYAKMTVPPVDVMMVIVCRMTEMLQDPHMSHNFDAQALSNSVWALAHIRSKEVDLDAAAGKPGCVKLFLQGVANVASMLLNGLGTRMDLSQLQTCMMEAEKRFSCQAMVNIVWSFATMLGDECSKHPDFKMFFLQIRREAIIRLHATSSGLQLNHAWIHKLAGGFNEQALSNIVYAFDKADMLDKELLQWVFNVAALRLDRMDRQNDCFRPYEFCFKPQELCTLLRAAHQYIAQPWTFLAKLEKIVHSRPYIISGWSTAELTELNRSFTLLRNFTVPLMQQRQHAAAVAAASMRSPGLVSMEQATTPAQNLQHLMLQQHPTVMMPGRQMTPVSGLNNPTMELLLAQEGLQQALAQYQQAQSLSAASNAALFFGNMS